MTSRYTEPNDADYLRLAEQWVGIVNLVRDEYGADLPTTVEGLGVLQRVIDDQLIDPTNVYGLLCLGVALGRIFVNNIDGLDWWVVDDSSGRDLCVRYRETTLQVNPITMIHMRVVTGDYPDLAFLFRSMAEKIDELKDQVA